MVTVKLLIWEPGDGVTRGEQCYRANDGFGGCYQVMEGQVSHWNMDIYNVFDNDDLAKDCAQKHYEKLILSAIEPIK